jgi:predicted AAA+ superfamily ATPase
MYEDEAGFNRCIGELQEQAGLAQLTEQQLQDASKWAKEHGGRSIQTAAQFSSLMAA